MKNTSKYSFATSVIVAILFGSCMSSSKTDITPSSKNRARDSGDDQVCNTIEIDWWSVSCSPNVCYWSYMYKETKTTCWYSGGSRGPGGGGTYFAFEPSTRPLDDLLNKILATNELNASQTQ